MGAEQNASDPAARALAAATRLHARGVTENNAGHPSRARRYLRSALAGLDRLDGNGADELRARIWISLATSESELRGMRAGFDALEQAQACLGERPAPELRAMLYMQRGYMQVRGGNLHDGLAELDAAVALIDLAPADQAFSILLNRGTALLFDGRLAAARADLTRAVDVAEGLDAPMDLAMARHNLGYVEFLAGNLALALSTMDAAGAGAQDPIALTDKARVLMEAGLHREADRALERAGELFGAERLFKDVGEVELARAECALLAGENEAVRRLAARARDRFRRRANTRWRREAELLLLQGDLAAGRPGGRLAGPALRLAGEFRADGMSDRARTAQLVAAQALLRAGRPDQARRVVAEAGPIGSTARIADRLHTRLVRASLSIHAGERAPAAREIRAGLAELARHQAQFGSLDLQTAGAVHGRRLAALDVGLALDRGRGADVLAAVERGRSVSSRLPAVMAPPEAETGRLLAELRQAVEELRVVESDVEARVQAHRLRRRIAELQQDLRARAWRSQGSGTADRPAPVTEIAAALQRHHSVLVCLVEQQGALVAVVLDRRPRLVPLGSAAPVLERHRRVRADLDVLAADQLPDRLGAVVTRSLARGFDALDEVLLRPLRLAPGRPVVIVPTGVLATVAWSCLPSLRGRPVTVAPSATAWLRASLPVSAHRVGVEVFTGPELAFADAEANGVRQAWRDREGVRMHAGPDSSQQTLATGMARARLVHVAAHGQHEAQNPLFSSVRLSDGPVYAYEFDATSDAPEHVVLSACELGQATMRPGDEALGLTSVLLHLGSRSVVSGVARVHDETSAQVMTEYHRLLAGGSDSAAALALAVAGSRDFPAPYVCFGASWSW